MNKVLNTVIKRDGSSVPFDKKKIAMAIFKAMLSVKIGSMEEANKLADYVAQELETSSEVPTVELIQDTVEKVLMTRRINDVSYIAAAKAYILYREKRNTIRQEKEFIGVKDDLKLSLNAVKVLEARYLFKDSEGKIIETPKQMFHRVAVHLGIIQGLYDYISYRKTGKLNEKGTVYTGITKTQDEELQRAFNELKKEKAIDGTYTEFIDFIKTKKNMINYWIEKFENMMIKLEYVPNSPTLMNAGGPLGQLSACFVLPVDDSIDSIFDTLKATAEIHKSGGGTGFSFSRLRASDDIVASTKGVASGPVSFMRIFDVTTDVIKQGGKRRGANMGILNYNHPNIMDFINSKDVENKILSNFNISVGVNDEFFEKLDNDENVDLINPRDGKVTGRVKATTLWNSIIDHAWLTADPGMIFLDEINKKNPVKNIGYIESTNPCGEQPLLPYESCNLGSINLAKFVEDGKFNYERYKETIDVATRFLENVVDANKFPVESIKNMTRKTRKIGLGIMGFADALIMLGIPYNSNEALEFAENVMKTLNDESHMESQKLAAERGVFPGWYGSEYEEKGIKMRNSTTTTIAPTGTISIIAGCSSSIEPLFALAFVRHVLNGQELLEVNPLLENALKSRNLWTQELMEKIAETGKLGNLDLPEDVKNLFITAQEIDPDWHVLMQATFQKYCDSGVSKTINLPFDATREDIAKSYRLAKELHCKGITVYRDRSKSQQVLYAGTNQKKSDEEHKIDLTMKMPDKLLKLGATFDPACPTGKCDL
ncbi:adenosylcobalamin-dependent ribonucleoside-diphosphate reductase [Ferroplasma acidiphilum]|jgi:ribonucleoside-diphosphate reductase alpha chain|uniref:Vitamin B12-dependent ribonucleotide reductase n=2 Tax=Ferroplasma acidiphilum TaxID=74969 RepID=A0A7K4FLJ0_9ARCH|nr:adenosylcobalamin-dependent ribonucleoside-diphosphate reductase [Ferroplasma acidiphilum]MCL4349709.1 adenosylcobalamin-dependent ribonucleoside-diphosphate reductase [Candidatus Thermoplasmatota archaeon]NOL59912.1 adenosylcobalamin-dependent ribonucleoside-diphosphate reductase [Ferroplasma acidiphilum]WMT52497.1 MAG: adenosylcobalamin-dependent ribonucleoside-diphosphate reductase [Ferroplasma acidiphilum]